MNGIPFAFPPAMTDAALEKVYRYRQLAGKCELGTGLELDEIMEITAIEAAFATTAGCGEWSDEREFVRAPADLAGRLSSRRYDDPVRITDLGPGGMEICDAPYLERGDAVQIAVSQESGCFRFAAEVAWVREEGATSKVGLKLCGVPVLLRKPPRRLPAAAPVPAPAQPAIPAAA